VAVALADFEFAVGAMGEAARGELAGPGAEAHGAAHFVYAEEFAQFVDDTVGSLRIELGAVGGFQFGYVAGVLDGGALHAQADSEKGNFVLASVLNGVDHALNAALAESAGYQDAIVAAQAGCGGIRGVDFFGFDPLENRLWL